MPIAHSKPTMLAEANYERNVWCVTVKNDVDKDTLTDKDFWVHVAYQLTAGDRVEVTPENRSYFVELFVVGASKTFAKLVELRNVVILDDATNASDAEYTVEFANSEKWRVTSGNRVLAKDFDDKAAAMDWLTQHKREFK